jgi:PAS domain S-box-containing protein
MDSSLPASISGSRDGLATLLDGIGAGAGVIEMLPDGCLRFGPTNDRLRAGLGHRDSLAGRVLAEVLPAAAAAAWEARCRQCEEERHPVTWQAELDLAAGRRCWHTVLGPLPDRSGRVARILAVAFDITDRVAGARSVQALAAHLAQAVEAIDQGLAVWDGDERLVHCNRRYRQHHPVVSARLEPGAAYRALAWEAARQAAAVPAAEAAERPVDGRWITTTERPLADGGLVTLTTDLTPLRLARRTAADLRSTVRAGLEATADGILVLTADGTVVEANGGAATLLGLGPDPPAGRNLWERIDGSLADTLAALVEAALSAGQAEERQIAWRGRQIAMTARAIRPPGGAPAAVAVAARDRSEVEAANGRALEVQQLLARYLRIANLGEMAAGLAHEINQPITAVLNYCRGSLRQLAEGRIDADELTMALTEACREAERASAIVRNIHGFVARSPGSRAPTALNAVVEGVGERVRRELRRHKVELNLDLMPGLPAVALNAVEIEQVVLNLVRNAIDAVAATGNGERRVSVRTSRAEAGALRVSVADTGPGFAPEALAQAFTPFFTTKPGGVGMGLAICRTIVEGHGGRIEARPDPAGGAVVQFTLPVEEHPLVP